MVLQKLQERGEIVLVCPEVAGGLSVPRPPSEIILGDGADILDGKGRIINRIGEDVTDAFVRGAHDALQLCRQFDIKVAILKARSPSCSKEMIYDGTFTGTLKPGKGVTAALLEREGIEIFDEAQIESALVKAGIRF